MCIGPPSMGIALIYGMPTEDWECALREPKNLISMEGWLQEGADGTPSHELATTGVWPLTSESWWHMQSNAKDPSYEIIGALLL